MRKPITAILISALFCFYTGGAFIFFLVRRIAIKSEMKAFIRNNPDLGGTVVSLAVKNNKVQDESFEWEEDGAEFSYRGEMYDVVLVKNEPGRLILHCLKDDDENALLDWYKKAEKNKGGKSSSGQLFKFFNQLFYSGETRSDILVAGDQTHSFLYINPPLAKGYCYSPEKPPQG